MAPPLHLHVKARSLLTLPSHGTPSSTGIPSANSTLGGYHVWVIPWESDSSLHRFLTRAGRSGGRQGACRGPRWSPGPSFDELWSTDGILTEEHCRLRCEDRHDCLAFEFSRFSPKQNPDKFTQCRLHKNVITRTLPMPGRVCYAKRPPVLGRGVRPEPSPCFRIAAQRHAGGAPADFQSCHDLRFADLRGANLEKASNPNPTPPHERPPLYTPS